MRFQVSVVNANADILSSTVRALDLLKWSPNENGSYLVKPNMLNSKTSEQGVTTDPRLVKAIVGVLRSAGARTLVGDSPGNAYPGKARTVFKNTGMLEAVISAGAEFIEFEESPPQIVETNGELIKTIGLGKAVFEHKIINVPKLKTHLQTVMSGAIKNLAMGCIQGSGKGMIHEIGRTGESMAKAMIDVYSIIRPQVSLNIMDAIVCMEGNGPSSGRPINVGRLLASRDALALDMVAFRMAGIDPMKVPHIKEAARRSLGPSSFSEIEILGDEPTPFKFKMAKTFVYNMLLYTGSLAEAALGASIWFDHSKCTQCGECKDICPVNAIMLKPYPELDSSKCIKCYTCHEICEHNAVKIKRSKLS